MSHRDYAARMHEKGEGWALFHPTPSDDLPEEARKAGLQIGEVGVITDDGAFDPIFNIRLAADDPANRYGVPAGFEQVPSRPNDIRIRLLCHPPGAVLSSATVKKTRLDLHASLPSNPQVFPWLRINHHLILYTSADYSRSLLVRLSSYRRNRSSWQWRSSRTEPHASWYGFVTNDLQRIVGNGGLYLITGVTKSTSWCIAVVDDSAGSGKVSLVLKAAQFGGAGATHTWEWETSSSTVHFGPHPSPGEEDWRDNQTLFIRGFKIVLPGPLSKSPKVTSIVKSKPEAILSTTTF